MVPFISFLEALISAEAERWASVNNLWSHLHQENLTVFWLWSSCCLMMRFWSWIWVLHFTYNYTYTLVQCNSSMQSFTCCKKKEDKMWIWWRLQAECHAYCQSHWWCYQGGANCVCLFMNSEHVWWMLADAYRHYQRLTHEIVNIIRYYSPQSEIMCTFISSVW